MTAFEEFVESPQIQPDHVSYLGGVVQAGEPLTVDDPDDHRSGNPSELRNHGSRKLEQTCFDPWRCVFGLLTLCHTPYDRLRTSVESREKGEDMALPPKPRVIPFADLKEDNKLIKTCPHCGKEEELNPTDFIVPAKTKNGTSSPITVKVPEEWLRRAQELVMTRKLRYKTVSDLFRHSLIRHINWLEEITPDVSVWWNFFYATYKIVQASEELSIAYKNLDYLSDVVNDFVAKGMIAEARRMVLDYIRTIHKSPDGKTGWKTKILSEVQARHGDLIKSGASIKPSTFEEEEG